jgi:hypothetical protein
MTHRVSSQSAPHDPLSTLNTRHVDDLLVIAQVLGSSPDATSARAIQLDDDGIVLAASTPRGESRVRVGFAVVDRRGDAGRRLAFRRLVRRAREVVTRSC